MSSDYIKRRALASLRGRWYKMMYTAGYGPVRYFVRCQERWEHAKEVLGYA